MSSNLKRKLQTSIRNSLPQKLREILKKNSYPSGIIEVSIRTFLNRLYVPKQVYLTAPKKELLIILPFIGTMSSNLKRKLQTSIRNSLPQKLREILKKNSYPSGIIEVSIRTFLNRLYVPKQVYLTAPKKELLIILPFLGTMSSNLKRKLQTSIRNSLPQKLREILKKNSYPSGIIEVSIRTFLNRRYVPKQVYLTAPKKELLIILPFLGTMSSNLKRKLQTSIRNSLLDLSDMKRVKMGPPKFDHVAITKF